MLCNIVESTHGHPLKGLKLTKEDKTFETCSLGKLITKHSLGKIQKESPAFLERIQADICELSIHRQDHSGTLWY